MKPVHTSKRRGRRTALGVAGTAMIGALLAGGPGACSAPFDPPSYVNTLRIFAVSADTPFALEPQRDPDTGELVEQTVTFKMTYADARPDDTFVPVTIVWIGGCFNPEGQQYYGCFDQLGEIFEGLQSGQPDPNGYVSAGPGVDTFELKIPEGVVSDLPDPEYGSKYGLAYVFFLACAGEVRPVVQQGDTAAGFFPLGCFDSEGRELGPDAFIPGYTQIYIFEDGRQNENPEVKGFVYDGETQAPDETLQATVCPVTLEERRKSGCSATDEFVECEVHELDIDVDDSVSEIDEGALDANGDPLNEVVWVTYFASGGTFQGDTKLVSDAQEGLLDDRAIEWVAPEEAGTYQLWAVTRDNRGGSTVATHFVEVNE